MREVRDPNWKEALLGMGLAGAANLAGLGPQAAHQFFVAPELRAERDYAREYAAYQGRQQSWQDYYDQLARAETLDIQRRQLERPVTLPYGGTAVDPTRRGAESVIYQDPRREFGGTQWEFDRQQANALYAERNNLDPNRLTEEQETQAFREYRQMLGQEPVSPVFEEDGIVRRIPRSLAYERAGPVTVFGAEGVQTGGVPGARLTEERAPQQRGLSDQQRLQLDLDEAEDLLGAIDDEERESIRRGYEIQRVRGKRHAEGQTIDRDTAVEYYRIARMAVGDAATRDQVIRQAEAWAREDGWNWIITE